MTTMKAVNTTLCATLALAIFSGSAFAANTTSANAAAVAPSVMDKMTASFTAVAFGPSISEASSGLQPDSATGALDVGSPLMMKNYLGLGYKLGQGRKIEAVAYWSTQLTRGMDYTIRDPYLKISQGKFLTRGEFSMAADLRLAAPVKQTSRDANMITYLMSKQVSTLNIPGSRFTPGIVTYALVRAHSSKLVAADQESAKQKDIEIYAGPNVDYKISDTVTANLLYELSADHNMGQRMGAFNNGGTDLEPGISWDITPKMTLNPFLDIKTGQRVALDTTSYNLFFTWSML